MSPLRGFLTLLSAPPENGPDEEELEQARRELEAALEALRRARGGWGGRETVDVDAVRRALDIAQRQLDVAKAALERALARRRRGQLK